jgi:hypothetical protein
VGLLDKRDPGSSLDGEQREFADEMPYRPGLRVGRLADANLSTRAVGGEPVEIGVIAGRDLMTSAACATWSRTWVRVKAQQPRGEVHGERGLAARCRTHEEHRMRRGTEDHGTDCCQRTWLTAGHNMFHRQLPRNERGPSG